MEILKVAIGIALTISVLKFITLLLEPLHEQWFTRTVEVLGWIQAASMALCDEDDPRTNVDFTDFEFRVLRCFVTLCDSDYIIATDHPYWYYISSFFIRDHLLAHQRLLLQLSALSPYDKYGDMSMVYLLLRMMYRTCLVLLLLNTIACPFIIFYLHFINAYPYSLLNRITFTLAMVYEETKNKKLSSNEN